MIIFLEWTSLAIASALIGIVVDKTIERWWSDRKVKHSEAAARAAFDKEHPYD